MTVDTLIGSHGAPGLITIDLDRLAANWRALRDAVTPSECAAVVKADAYGLGARRVVPALYAAGCRTFFVALVDEARDIRRLAPDAIIYALDGVLPGAGEAMARNGVRPVLSTLDDVAAWSKLATARGMTRPAALHIDTGLNRLGLPARDIRRLAAEPELLAGIEVALVMSHLACADQPDDPKNRDQLLTFETLTTLLPRTPRSLAASDGLMLGPAYHFDLVRPGYALYGGQALSARPAPVQPVVTVAARILQIRDVAPGESVGYSATWMAAAPARIAVIAAGYADGVPRNASATNANSGGAVLINGVRAPIVGRVSMDLITVDVTSVAPAPRAGDLATLIGDGLTLEDAGHAGGTIGYEILTRLGRRFERVYVGGIAGDGQKDGDGQTE